MPTITNAEIAAEYAQHVEAGKFPENGVTQYTANEMLKILQARFQADEKRNRMFGGFIETKKEMFEKLNKFPADYIMK